MKTRAVQVAMTIFLVATIGLEGGGRAHGDQSKKGGEICGTYQAK